LTNQGNGRSDECCRTSKDRLSWFKPPANSVIVSGSLSAVEACLGPPSSATLDENRY